MKNNLYVSFFVLIASFIFIPSVTLAAKVNLSATSTTLSEGTGSQAFDISLDEPIISIEDDGYVRLNISADDARLVFSTSSIYFAELDWSDTRTFTVSASDDYIQNADNTAVITINTVSNSEYYSGYSRTIAVTILDNYVQPSYRSAAQTGVTSIIYGCRDSAAKNYDRFTAHRQELCVYETRTAIQNISKDIYQGMQSVDVLTLQKFLIAENAGQQARALAKAIARLQTSSTGYFGALTRKALLEWQQYVQVTATGVFDTKTRMHVQSSN